MLGLLLGQASAQAAQLEAVMAQQRAQLQVAQFRQQAAAASSQKRLDPDIADLADHFNVEESLARSLDNVMQGRTDSFEADMLTLWELLERAENPSAVLSEKLGELASGTFVARSKDHGAVVKFCKKYELDETATKNLIDALAVRERDHEANIKRDLDKLAVHMEHSSHPSKLISMKLKEIRGGCNIGAVWHCCGDSRKRDKEKKKPPEKPPPDGGPGIEGVRGSRPRQGTYKSYTDLELTQRFERNTDRSEGLMTEEQALSFQRNIRRDEVARQERRSRSRSRSRSRHSRPRRRQRSRSPSYRRRRGR